MNHLGLLVVVMTGLMHVMSFGQQANPGKPIGTAAEIGRMIEQRLAEIDPADHAAMITLALDSAERLGAHWQASTRLRDAAERLRSNPAQGDLDQLRATLRRTAADLQFTLATEAELPEGFPAPTTVGEIEIKHYGVYRLALAGPDVAAPTRFFQLFFHIQRENIPMTAPVEMTYSDEQGRRLESSMAFLYPDTRTGRLGQDGPLQVIDTQPLTVVSIGVQGKITPARVSAARDQLNDWLQANPNWKTAGDIRVMGYNSPRVPDNKSYFEVQIPVGQ